MPTKYTEEEIDLITGHLAPLIHVAQQTAKEFKRASKKRPSSYATGCVVYWTHVASGLKWALEQAKQRGKGGPKRASNTKSSAATGTVKRG